MRGLQSPPLAWVERSISGYPAQRRALWRWVDEWTGHPVLIDFAARLIRIAEVPERDTRRLARAVQKFVQRTIKYFREQPERWASPLRTLAWRIGDCDDKAVLISSILRGFRVPMRLKCLRFRLPDGRKVSHVDPQAKLDGQWAALESVRPYPLGADPETLARARGFRPYVELIGDR